MTFEEKSAWAGEYVLGTLSADERRRLESSLPSDPELAAAVRYWEETLIGLTSAIPPVAPPPAIWNRIAVATGATTNSSEAPDLVERLKRRIAGWRLATVGAGALAVALGALVIAGPLLDSEPAVEDGERYVAVVDRGEDLPALLVDVDTRTGVIAVVSVSSAAPPGRSHELWYIAEGEAPRSLGLVDTVGAELQISVDQVTGFHPDGALFAITEEPLGGSPTGEPTSTPIFTGQLIAAPSLSRID